MKPMFTRNAKKVYAIDGKHFVSDKGTRNGKQKAVQYCYDNMLNPDEIIVFDSEMEWKRYTFLIALYIADKITRPSLHHSFLIQPEFTDSNGIPHNAITYEADFFYYDNAGLPHVEDVKGFEEEEFRLKEKLFDYAYKDKGMYINAIRLKARCDPMMDDNWESLTEIKGKPKKTTKKLRDENTQMKETLHNAQKEANKLQKLKERYFILKDKNKLSTAEKKRLDEITIYLKEKGLIL